MKKKKISNLLVNLLTTIAIIVALFTVVSVLTVNKNDRNILGYKFYVCLSNSMKATDFEAGDLVVSKNVDVSTLKEGDIITFVSTDISNAGEVVTHKIKKVEMTGALYQFTTYGTTTGTEDPTKVDGVNILGKYQFSIPKLGYVFNFIKTIPGYICCIFIPFMFIILVQLYNTIKTFKVLKRMEKEEIELERRQLVEEKNRTEQLLKEANEKLAALNNKTDSKSNDQ